MKRFLVCFLLMMISVSFLMSYAEQDYDYDQMLVDALIKAATAEFKDPSAVRVLEINNFERFKFPEDEDCSPWNVVVRLQGEYRVGGASNHYYYLCIKEGEATSEKARELLEGSYDMIGYLPQLGMEISWLHYKTIQEFKAELGNIVDIGDSYSPLEPAEEFSIKNVNQALKAYWEDMGF